MGSMSWTAKQQRLIGRAAVCGGLLAAAVSFGSGVAGASPTTHVPGTGAAATSLPALNGPAPLQPPFAPPPPPPFFGSPPPPGF
jgi:hypothetical protein